MYCGIFEAVNTAQQTVLANANIAFATTKFANGISLNNNTVVVPYRGIYQITFNADITPESAGTMTVTVNNNGEAIATSTYSAVADTAAGISLDTLLQVKPSCFAVSNTANITVSLNAQGTVANADIIVTKIR